MPATKRPLIAPVAIGAAPKAVSASLSSASKKACNMPTVIAETANGRSVPFGFKGSMPAPVSTD